MTDIVTIINEERDMFAHFLMEREIPTWKKHIDGHHGNEQFIRDRVAHYRAQIGEFVANYDTAVYGRLT